MIPISTGRAPAPPIARTWAKSSVSTPPASMPPMCPPTEMFGTLKVKIRLMIDVEADLRGDVVHAAVPGLDEARRHEPEDGARCTDGQVLGREDQGAERAAEKRDEEDPGEAPSAHRALQQGAEEEEREHVYAEVEDPRVEESARDDPVVLALADSDQLLRPGVGAETEQAVVEGHRRQRGCR